MYVFYRLHAGGAIEMILIGGIVVKDNEGQSQWYTILGYLFLLGNTLCMVRCVCCGCGALDHVTFFRDFMFCYKRNWCSCRIVSV